MTRRPWRKLGVPVSCDDVGLAARGFDKDRRPRADAAASVSRSADRARRREAGDGGTGDGHVAASCLLPTLFDRVQRGRIVDVRRAARAWGERRADELLTLRAAVGVAALRGDERGGVLRLQVVAADRAGVGRRMVTVRTDAVPAIGREADVVHGRRAFDQSARRRRCDGGTASVRPALLDLVEEARIAHEGRAAATGGEAPGDHLLALALAADVTALRGRQRGAVLTHQQLAEGAGVGARATGDSARAAEPARAGAARARVVAPQRLAAPDDPKTKNVSANRSALMSQSRKQLPDHRKSSRDAALFAAPLRNLTAHDSDREGRRRVGDASARIGAPGFRAACGSVCGRPASGSSRREIPANPRR